MLIGDLYSKGCAKVSVVDFFECFYSLNICGLAINSLYNASSARFQLNGKHRQNLQIQPIGTYARRVDTYSYCGNCVGCLWDQKLARVGSSHTTSRIITLELLGEYDSSILFGSSRILVNYLLPPSTGNAGLLR